MPSKCFWIKKEDVEGIPEGLLEGAAAMAEAKGKKGQWLFTLSIPSYLPFLTYAKNRTLREKMWRAYAGRAYKGEFDNQGNVLKIVELRDRRAKLLGFKSHADFVLAERMAKSAQTVMDFLSKLLKASKDAGKRDLNEVIEFAKKADGLTEIMHWDFGYYSEKLKEEKYSFNEEDLRPYFQLEKRGGGSFYSRAKTLRPDFQRKQRYSRLSSRS